MPTPTEYTYSIANDITAHALAGDRLHQSIQASSIVIVLDHVSSSGDVLTIGFRDALSDADHATLTALVQAHSGVPLPQSEATVSIDAPKTADNKLRFVAEKGTVTRTNFYLHNFCDPTTWYSQSVRVAGEVPTNPSNDLTVYQLAHTNIIDAAHAKLVNEDTLKDAGGYSYRVTVTVNSQPKTEHVWPATNGGDYGVDYAAGTITFATPLQGGDAVAVTYHYANGSRFTIAPAAGKKVVMQLAKACFSPDTVVMNDSLHFDVYGLVDAFRPDLVGNGQGQIPSGTKILLQGFTYKTMRDFVMDAHEIDQATPAIGGGGPRSSPKILNFDWDYVSSTALRSTLGMEIRVFLEHNVPMSGEICSATFYGNSEADV